MRAPIAYRLRDACEDRWVRFHSLPESKRYAKDESEYRIIIERHYSMLAELAEPNEELVFISTGYSGTSYPIRDDSNLNELDPTAQCWRTLAKHELEDDEDYPNYWHLLMSAWS